MYFLSIGGQKSIICCREWFDIIIIHRTVFIIKTQRIWNIIYPKSNHTQSQCSFVIIKRHCKTHIIIFPHTCKPFRMLCSDLDSVFHIQRCQCCWIPKSRSHIIHRCHESIAHCLCPSTQPDGEKFVTIFLGK